MAYVPQRFAKKMGLLNYKSARREGREGDESPLGADHRPSALPQNRGQWSAWFPSLWDRIIDFMRYEDKLDDYMASQMKFKPDEAMVSWNTLQAELKRQQSFRPPPLLTASSFGVRLLKRTFGVLRDEHFPKNKELQWRFKTFARNLQLSNLPKPFKPPYLPSFTVLIPHYGESILLRKHDLISEDQSEVPLISWLTKRYADDYQNFMARQRASPEGWITHSRPTSWDGWYLETWVGQRRTKL